MLYEGYWVFPDGEWEKVRGRHQEHLLREAERFQVPRHLLEEGNGWRRFEELEEIFIRRGFVKVRRMSNAWSVMGLGLRRSLSRLRRWAREEGTREDPYTEVTFHDLETGGVVRRISVREIGGRR